MESITQGAFYRKKTLVELMDYDLITNEFLIRNDGDPFQWRIAAEKFKSTYEPAVPVSGAILFEDLEFDFGVAIRLLKEGTYVCRKGWNGKGMFLLYVDPYLNDQFKVTELPYMVGTLMPYLAMKTADNKLIPWLASQSDMLADDWVVL